MKRPPPDSTRPPIAYEADDHKRYYPGSHPIAMRYIGDRRIGRLLRLQFVGQRSGGAAFEDLPSRVAGALQAAHQLLLTDGEVGALFKELFVAHGIPQ